MYVYFVSTDDVASENHIQVWPTKIVSPTLIPVTETVLGKSDWPQNLLNFWSLVSIPHRILDNDFRKLRISSEYSMCRIRTNVAFVREFHELQRQSHRVQKRKRQEISMVSYLASTLLVNEFLFWSVQDELITARSWVRSRAPTLFQKNGFARCTTPARSVINSSGSARVVRDSQCSQAHITQHRNSV